MRARGTVSAVCRSPSTTKQFAHLMKGTLHHPLLRATAHVWVSVGGSGLSPRGRRDILEGFQGLVVEGEVGKVLLQAR